MLALLCKLVYTHVHVLAASCLLVGYVGDRGASLTRRSTLAFRWAIAIDGGIHESEIHVRADNASERGVPFPASWRNDLNIGAAQPVVDVDDLARSAVRRAHEEHSLSEAAQLECRPPCAHPHAHAAIAFLCRCAYLGTTACACTLVKGTLGTPMLPCICTAISSSTGRSR